MLTNISSSAVGAQGESSLNFTAYHERKRPSEEEWEKRERRETDLAQKLLTPPSLLLKIPKQRRLLLNVQQRLINLFLRELRRRVRERHSPICGDLGTDVV